MPRTLYAGFGKQNDTFASQTRDAGAVLILPDERSFRYTLNDATAEVAANLYQAALPIANHENRACDVARAVGAVAISATLGATAATVDLYQEGIIHVNDAAGEGYAHRIRRARVASDAHASVLSSGIITVNLAAGESVQVALTTSSEVSFHHNRHRVVLIHDSPPTAVLVGVSPGVAAASRWYYSQVGGIAACLVSGTVVIGDFCVPSATVDGAVMPSAAFETDGPYVGIVAGLGNSTTDGEEVIVDLKIG